MSGPGSAVPEISQTLDRGLRLLSLLTRREHAAGLTVTELAQALGVGRPVVYRLVATLEGHDLVRRDTAGRVSLGIGVTALTGSVLPTLQGTLAPPLRELAEAVGATAHVTIDDGDEALAVAVVEPSWPTFSVAYRRGARHPLTQGASGRAVLAARAGRHTLVTSEGELQAGAHGIATPLLLRGGALAASVGVVSLAALDPALVAPHLHTAAGRVAELLG